MVDSDTRALQRHLWPWIIINLLEVQGQLSVSYFPITVLDTAEITETMCCNKMDK